MSRGVSKARANTQPVLPSRSCLLPCPVPPLPVCPQPCFLDDPCHAWLLFCLHKENKNTPPPKHPMNSCFIPSTRIPRLSMGPRKLWAARSTEGILNLSSPTAARMQEMPRDNPIPSPQLHPGVSTGCLPVPAIQRAVSSPTSLLPCPSQMLQGCHMSCRPLGLVVAVQRLHTPLQSPRPRLGAQVPCLRP